MENTTEGVVEPMAIDDDIEKIQTVLDKHEGRLDKVECDITELKISTEISKEKLTNLEKSNDEIKSTLVRMETNMTTGQSASINATNALTQLVINLANNNTQVETSKNEANTAIANAETAKAGVSTTKWTTFKEIGLKVLLIVGGLVGGYVASKYGFSPITF